MDNPGRECVRGKDSGPNGEVSNRTQASPSIRSRKDGWIMKDRIPDTYLQARTAVAEEKLAEQGLDALIVMDPAQKGYLSGFTTGVNIAPGGFLLLTPADIPNYYVTGGVDHEDCRTALQPLGYRVRAYNYGLGENAASVTVGVIGELDLERVGTEARRTTVAAFRDLGDRLDAVGAELVALEESIVDPLREVKDPWETEQIEKANEVSRAAFEHVLGLIRPGVTEWVLAAELENQLRLHGSGSSRLAFQSIVVSGPRSSLPHGAVTHRALERGDFVTFDFGATWNGYCADVTRTVVLGRASDRQREVYSAVLDAQRAAIDLMHPGRDRREGSGVGAGIIEERGFAEYMAHGAGGHGIGLEVHEGPSSRDDGQWQVGNIVTVEPGIYIPGWGGVRIEDDVVITGDGPRIITDIPKDLVQL